MHDYPIPHCGYLEPVITPGRGVLGATGFLRPGMPLFVFEIGEIDPIVSDPDRQADWLAKELEDGIGVIYLTRRYSNSEGRWERQQEDCFPGNSSRFGPDHSLKNSRVNDLRR